MASYVVRIDDLQRLVTDWQALVAQRQKPATGRFDYRQQVFVHLCDPQFRRIRWFYYNDNDNGVTIRLYDRAFVAQYPGDFIDNDDCILRGYDLGAEHEPVKTAMRALFAQSNRQQLPGGQTRRHSRSVFFEEPAYNNALGGSSPPPPPPTNATVNISVEVTIDRVLVGIVRFNPSGLTWLPRGQAAGHRLTWRQLEDCASRHGEPIGTG